MMRYRRGPGPYWQDNWPAIAIGMIGMAISADPETPGWLAAAIATLSLVVIVVIVGVGVAIWWIDRDMKKREDQDDQGGG